mmetsp:Transcript_104634/g.305485  ORF Transcript_104634/g.305485 Transcript_104634/m.305485 type:complete len:301 (-) Transcript_104634:3781-4683(-)
MPESFVCAIPLQWDPTPCASEAVPGAEEGALLGQGHELIRVLLKLGVAVGVRLRHSRGIKAGNGEAVLHWTVPLEEAGPVRVVLSHEEVVPAQAVVQGGLLRVDLLKQDRGEVALQGPDLEVVAVPLLQRARLGHRRGLQRPGPRPGQPPGGAGDLARQEAVGHGQDRPDDVRGPGRERGVRRDVAKGDAAVGQERDGVQELLGLEAPVAEPREELRGPDGRQRRVGDVGVVHDVRGQGRVEHLGELQAVGDRVLGYHRRCEQCGLRVHLGDHAYDALSKGGVCGWWDGQFHRGCRNGPV